MAGLKRIGRLICAVCLGVLAGDCVLAEDPPQRFEFSQIEMGVQFRLAFYASSREAANKAAEAAFGRIRELNGRLSDYDSSSELMRLCSSGTPGQAVPVSDDLWTVLVASQKLAEQSDGAFDVTVGPLTKLWRRSRRQKELPAPEDLAAARQLVGWRSVRLKPDSKSVELLKTGLRIDLGGIAKGYAADAALLRLREFGVQRALIAASGDIAVSDPPPGTAGWELVVESTAQKESPALRLKLANAAVSTAGDAYQFVEIAGKRYSHIVDTRTGLGLESRGSVTVIAPSGLIADGLDTTALLLGAERGLEFVKTEQKAGVRVEALFQTMTSAGVELRQTDGFAKFVIPSGR